MKIVTIFFGNMFDIDDPQNQYVFEMLNFKSIHFSTFPTLNRNI